jgi:thrombospondin type 3 repeat protein
VKIAMMLLGLLLPLGAAAASNLTSSVLDGAGGSSSGSSLELISSAAQPGGISVSSGGDWVNSAGFLNTFILQPGLDTDGDGLPDELDPDNDDDSVTDTDEVTGAAYAGPGATDPNDFDSDSDGMQDGQEAAAGSDPNDSSMYLHLTEIDGNGAPTEMSVQWQAQAGKTYEVYSLNAATDPRPGTYLGEVTAAGGVGPWFSTLTDYTDDVGVSIKYFYYVLLVEP